MSLNRTVISVLLICLFFCSAYQAKGKWCGPGFRSIDDYCLMKLNKQRFQDAKISCARFDASLFEIKTWHDQRVMQRFIKDNAITGNGLVWLDAQIGISRRTNGTYQVRWPVDPLSSLALFRLKNFKNANDLQTGRGKCVVMTTTLPGYYWQRYPCNSLAYPACVRKPFEDDDELWT